MADLPKTIKVDPFDQSSIDAAIQYLTKFRKNLEKVPRRVVDKSVKAGESIAKLNVADYSAIDTGWLMNSIHASVRRGGKSAAVIADAPHAAYVEYGTGYRGQNSPHPEPGSYPSGWVYDVNEHGVAGWIYKGDDGKLHFTQGFESRPYMYDTARMLRKEIPRLAREELDKIL